MKVFLSYASEDGGAADELAEWLDAKGVAFYDFRKPDRQGGRYAYSRPEAIAEADFFLVLLSPSMLKSEWCKQDLDMAILREQVLTGSKPGDTFIQVLLVGDVPWRYEGELRRYDWIDLTRTNGPESVSQELAYRLGIERRSADDKGSVSDAVIKSRRSPSAAESPDLENERTVMASENADNKHKRVMVIYGHDEEANRALFDCLRAMGLRPQEWGQLIKEIQVGSPYIGAVLDEAFKSVQAVVAFFTPDEHVISRARYADGHWRLQARPNVLLEAGMALATHPRETILLVLGEQELPSDLSGRHFIRLDGTVKPLKDLSDRLRTAGCAVELDGNDWLNTDRFPSRDNIPATPVRAPPRRRRAPDGEAPPG